MEKSESSLPLVRDFRKVLGIAPASGLEVAVISCNGCPQGQLVERASDIIAREIRAYTAFQVSVPPLLWESEKLSLKRCLLADARIALGCEHRCISKLFSQKCPPHREFVVPSDESQLEAFCADVISEVDRLLEVENPEGTTPIALSEIAPQRSFVSDSQWASAGRMAGDSPALSEVSSPIDAGGVSGETESIPADRSRTYGQFSGARRRGYFSSRESNSSGGFRLFLPLLLILLLAGGGFYYWRTAKVSVDSKDLSRVKEKGERRSGGSSQSAVSPPGGGDQLQSLGSPSDKKRPSFPTAEERVSSGRGGVPSPRAEAGERGISDGGSRQRSDDSSRPGISGDDGVAGKAGKSEGKPLAEGKKSDKSAGIRSDSPKSPGEAVPVNFIPRDPYNLRWIGGECAAAGHCENPGAFCFLTGARSGFCSQSCWGLCPDRRKPGYTMASCISARELRTLDERWKPSPYGYCLPRCSRRLYPKTGGCRPPLRCMALPQYTNPSKKVWVCVPVRKERKRR